jgi:hypothetical protein
VCHTLHFVMCDRLLLLGVGPEPMLAKAYVACGVGRLARLAELSCAGCSLTQGAAAQHGYLFDVFLCALGWTSY